MLREFPGYTLATLLDEDPLLLRLVKIEAMGRRPRRDAPEGGEMY